MIEVMDALLPRDGQMRAEVTAHRGVVLVRTRLSSLTAHNMVLSSLPRHISRVVPIEIECEPDLAAIAECALAALEAKRPGSFMVRCRTRGSELSASEVERAVGARIREKTSRRVDLKEPDLVVHIEVIEDFAGVSALPAGLPISMKSVRDNIVSSMRYILKRTGQSQR